MTTARVTQLTAAATCSGVAAEVRVTHEQVAFAGTGVAAEVRVTHLYVQVAVSDCVPVAGRIITTPLNDATLRPQFIGHKVVVEVTTDPLDITEADADWTTLESGYCTRATLVDALTWEVAIGDTDRVEREADLFASADSPVAGVPSAVLGQPTPIGSFGASTVADYPLFEVTYVESMHWILLGYLSGPLPVIVSEGVSTRDYVNELARPYASLASENHQYRRDYVYPDLVVELYDPTTGLLVTTGFGNRRTVDGQFTPISDNDRPAGNDPTLMGSDNLFSPGLQFAIDWAAGQPSIGAQYLVRMWCAAAKPLTPFHFDGHPVDIAAAIYDALAIPYDAASVTATRNALGPELRMLLRPTDAANALSVLEEWLYGPVGFAYRIVAGLREFYPTRYRDAATEPATTLTLADLRGEGTPYDLSDRGTLATVVWDEQGFAYWQVQGAESILQRPADGLIARQTTVTFRADDANAPPYLGKQTYTYPGQIIESVPLVEPSPPSYKSQVTEELFYRWGRGTAEVSFPLLPGFTEQIGDFVISEVDYSPIPEADQTPITVRPKDYPARTPRQVLQLVKRSDSPAGVDAVFQVVGPVAQDVTDALGALTVPTLTIAADVGHPLNAALVTVTNWATIQGDFQNRVDVEYGTGASEPTVWTPLGTLATAVSTGIATTPLFPAGTHFWTRARTWNTDGRVGVWSDVEDVILDALDPPTSFAGDPITDTQAVTYTWVNGDSVTPLVLRYLAPSASEWVTFAWLPAGTTRLVYTMPAPSTTYDVEIFHRQALEFVSESAHVEITLTTDVAGGALAAPTAPTVTTGGGLATFCVSVGDVRATTVMFQVSPENAGGTYTAWALYATRSVAGLGRLCAAYTIPQQQSLFDPLRTRYYSFRALHTAPGFVDSALTTPVVADAWAQSTAPPPIEGSYVTGSLLVALADGTLAPLPIGASTEVLTSDGTTASWEPASGGITGVVVSDTGTPVGTRPEINLIEGAGVTLTIADNSGADRVDITVDVAPAGGGVEILAEGASVGTRPAINLIKGEGIVSILAVDNSGADRVDITLSAGPKSDIPPASPDAMDDEFDATSGLWTWRNQGGASVSFANGEMHVSVPTNAGNNWRHLYQALPGSGAWEFRAKVRGIFGTTIFHAALAVRVSGTSKFMAIGYNNSGGLFGPHTERWTNDTSWYNNGTYYGSYFPIMLAPFYVSIVWDETYLYFNYSPTGEEDTFVLIQRETPGDWLGTPDQICLSFMVNDASVVGDCWYQWFRRVA